MANDNQDIGEIVKKCKILLLDIEGTTTSISFVKDKLFPYAEENVKEFLDSQWESEDVKGAVTALRKLALEDKENSVEGVVAIPGEDATKEEQIEGLVNNVKWQMSSDRKAGPLKLLQGLIWKKGYDCGEIKGHVYDDVSPALEQWRSIEGHKVYIYSSGSVDAQKLLFGQSLAGDLLPMIDGHFDTAVGAKQEPASYANIVEKIGCKPDEILFLTDILKEAEASRAAGLHAALVSREGNAPLPAGAAFPVLHSLQQLTVSNKRKPDPPTQDEQPAKMPKTEVEDVKSSIETNEIKETPTESEKKGKEEEKVEQMEVEEPAVVAEEKKEEKIDELPMESTVVEEITDTNDIEDVPIADIEPVVIEENIAKTDNKETEKMEAETIESSEVKPTKVKKGDVSAPVAEETPPTVITEIEEIEEKQDLADVGEIIDDLEPVVEEPPAVEDMEDLQNVGEVLEKECDEILSKVQDVTNLDNIPLKPLLNPIAEESMETENIDSNDIVDRILDTELDLEMKQCGDIDLNTVQEITDTNSIPEEKEASVTNEVPVTEKKTEEVNSVTDGNAVSSPKEKEDEPKVEDAKVAEIAEKEEVKQTTEVSVGNTPAKAEIEEEKPVVDATTDAATEKLDKAETEKPVVPASESTTETAAAETTTEKKETESVVAETKTVEEPQVNGKATNGDAKAVNVNGDASKDDELNSRLSVEEKRKEVVNGSNGDSNGANGDEQVNSDSKTDAEVADIKVKTVTVEEPRTDPIEQPTEA